MANVFTTIPVPSANGSGAGVDMTANDGLKAFICDVGSANEDIAITLEFSNEAVPTSWVPLVTFQGNGFWNQAIACRWVRATVENYKRGTPSPIRVGTSDNVGTTFATPVAPAGDGSGVAVDISAEPPLKTFHVGGTFRGIVLVEISEDGTTWYEAASFQRPGYYPMVVIAQFLRVSRTGVPLIAPGLPIVNMGATQPVGGGGGGGGGDANIVVWHNGEPWVDVYARIRTIRDDVGGPIICYVEVVPTGDPIPTITPPAIYNINDVQFISIYSLASGALGTDFGAIAIDDGVTLESTSVSGSPTVSISSVNIRWHPDCTTTPLVNDPTVTVRCNLVGEGSGYSFGIVCSAFAGGLVFVCDSFVAALQGCILSGTPSGTGMISAAFAKNVSMVTGSQIASLTFDDGALVEVSQDSTSLFDPLDACATNGDQAIIRLLDAASRVSYDDGLSSGTGTQGSLQATEVQEAIDVLKFMSWPEHRYNLWQVGVQTGGVASMSTWGFEPQIVGTPAAVAVAITDPAAATPRRSFTSAAGANSAAELWQVQVICAGNFTGYGGFKMIWRWIPTVTRPANMRAFHGLVDSATALATTTDPAALTNCIGFGWIIGQTTFRLIHNDAAGAATTTDLGADFPTNDPLALYTAMIWAEPNQTGFHWWIKNETIQEIAEGTVSANVPANTTQLGPHFHANNGGTAALLRFDFSYMALYAY